MMPIQAPPEARTLASRANPAGPRHWPTEGHARSGNGERTAVGGGPAEAPAGNAGDAGTARMGRVRRAIYATAVFVTLALVGMRGAFLFFDHEQAVARAEEATRDMALIVEEYTRRVFETGDLIAREITEELERRGGLAALGSLEVHRLLVDYAGRTSVGDYLVVVDDKGRVFAQSDAYPAAVVELADRPWFRAHAGGTERFIGEALFSPLGQEVLFTYSRRVEGPRDRFEGVVQVAIRPTVLNHLAQVGSLGDEVMLRVATAQGKLLAHTNMPANAAANDPSAVEWPGDNGGNAGGMAGTYRGTGTDGVERIMSFRRLGDWPVVVEAGIPVAAAMAPVREGLLWSIPILVAFLAGTAGLSALGVRFADRAEQLHRHLARYAASLAASDAEKDVLLREIHHRVKNNLQVTSSLLLMQAAKFGDPEVQAAFYETQERLRSIALVHETLYQAETAAHIDLRTYVRRLVEGVADTYGATARGIAVSVEVEPVTVSLERAVPLALVLTEVVTNAFKHAFPGAGGHVAVSAARRDGGLELCVHDDGRGMAEGAEAGVSLGLTLIRALASQLDATIAFRNDGGTVFRMHVPDVKPKAQP